MPRTSSASTPKWPITTRGSCALLALADSASRSLTKTGHVSCARSVSSPGTYPVANDRL